MMSQGLQTIGLSAVMTGMDNVRNMTGSPIAGIDPHELLDVRPLNYGALFLCPPSRDLAQNAANRCALLWPVTAWPYSAKATTDSISTPQASCSVLRHCKSMAQCRIDQLHHDVSISCSRA